MEVVRLRGDEMKWHVWEHHAKACRSARGLIPLSPNPLNAVQHFQLAQHVEVVNQECWVGSHTYALWFDVEY